MISNANDIPPPKPLSGVLIVRMALRHNNGHKCNNQRWRMSLHRRVWLILGLLDIIRLQALFIVICNDSFNNGNIQKYFRNIFCCCLCVYCPMTSVMDMVIFLKLSSYNIIFRHRFLDAIPISETLKCEKSTSQNCGNMVLFFHLRLGLQMKGQNIK
jgi:hypothetical protein